MLTSGGFAAARLHAEGRSCLDCAGLVAYFARTRKRPVTRLCGSTQNATTGQPRLPRDSPNLLSSPLICLTIFAVKR